MDKIKLNKDLYIETKEEIMLLLEICTLSGALLLKNGAEIYRVEDTVERIIKSRKNVRDADVYSTINVIIVSFNVNGHIYSNVRRVKDRGTNLVYVDKVNSFSRNFCNGKFSLKEALIELEKIKSYTGTGNLLITIGASVAASAFTALIEGNLIQCLLAFFVTLFSWTLKILVEKRKFGFFIECFTSGIFVSSFAIFYSWLFKVEGRDLITIGAFMPFLPGLVLTNSIRDLLTGDTTTGITGLTQAVLISTALALGVALPISLVG